MGTKDQRLNDTYLDIAILHRMQILEKQNGFTPEQLVYLRELCYNVDLSGYEENRLILEWLNELRLRRQVCG